MSIRERLYPNEQELPVLCSHCSDARYIWNLGLEQRNLWVQERPQKVTYNSQMLELAEAREQTWLGDGSLSIQQQALRDLDSACQNWRKMPEHSYRPAWRKTGINEGFTIRDPYVKRLNRKWGEVMIPNCGWVRFRVTREWTDIESASSARVTKDRSGRWFVSFTRPAPSLVRQSTGAAVGLEMGAALTVTTSDGSHLDMPALLSPGEDQRKRRLQRRLARQMEGSKRKAKTKCVISLKRANHSR